MININLSADIKELAKMRFTTLTTTWQPVVGDYYHDLNDGDYYGMYQIIEEDEWEYTVIKSGNFGEPKMVSKKDFTVNKFSIPVNLFKRI